MTNHLILGATGLIGRKLVNQLSLSKKTIALTRRKINDLPSNVSELLIDFDSLMIQGDYIDDYEHDNVAIIGRGVSYYLSMGLGSLFGGIMSSPNK